jgi:hypothetical protein
MANGGLIPTTTTTGFESSSKEREWTLLPFDTNVLGVQTALLAPSLAASLVETTLEECAAEGIELVYWTPDAHSPAASHFGNLPGYAVTQMVELTRALGGVDVAASCPAGFQFSIP